MANAIQIVAQGLDEELAGELLQYLDVIFLNLLKCVMQNFERCRQAKEVDEVHVQRLMLRDWRVCVGVSLPALHALLSSSVALTQSEWSSVLGRAVYQGTRKILHLGQQFRVHLHHL